MKFATIDPTLPDCGRAVRAPRGPRKRDASPEDERDRFVPTRSMGELTDDPVGDLDRLGDGEARDGVGGATLTGTTGDSTGGGVGIAGGGGGGIDSSTSVSAGGSINLGIGGSSSVSGGGSLNTGIGGAVSNSPPEAGGAGAGAGTSGGGGGTLNTGLVTTCGASTTGSGLGTTTGGTSAAAGNGGSGGGGGISLPIAMGAGLGARDEGLMLGFFATSCASRISRVSAPTESLLLLIRMSIGAVRFLNGIFRSDSRFLRARVGGSISL